MRSAYARWLLLVALATASLAVTGCANDQKTINRVQPNALEKSTLEGEWYFIQTVIDTPSTVNYTFVGDQSTLKKVVREIQENYLIARRSYQFIAGSEKPGPDPAENDAANTPLAMYKISKHFDIRRDYNPATGEQTNVIEENDVDKPWYDRKFMRVDWSENLVTDGDFMLLKRVIDGIETESTSYFVQNGPDAPKFEKNADGVVHYVDIVNKMFVKPTEVNIPDFGKIPTCLLRGAPQICEAGEISVRNSFLKVDEERDFQPVAYSGDRMTRFGFFVEERTGYSNDYGVVENERYRFAHRHNLWMKSHRKNSEGKFVGCTSDKQCDDGKGSKCDTDWGKAQRRYTDDGAPQGLCTIPYREREIRPVVYYTSSNLPADLAVDVESMAAEWNKAFVETVGSMREQECLASDKKACAAETKRDQKIFYICTTPVAENAPEACGERGIDPRPGDLRYHQIVWVSSEEAGGPLGFGPGNSDPETGETILGNAFIYGSAMERAAVSGRDIVGTLNGDLKVGDVQSGDYVTAWNKLAHATRSTEESDAVGLTAENLARNAATMDFSWAASDVVKSAPKSVAEFHKDVQLVRNQLVGQGSFGRGTDEGGARMSRLIGTDIEAKLLTPEMRVAAGLDPRSEDVSEAVLEAASPLRGRSIQSLNAIERTREMIEAKVGYFDGEFADDGLLGLALDIQSEAKKANGGSVAWYGRNYMSATARARSTTKPCAT